MKNKIYVSLYDFQKSKNYLQEANDLDECSNFVYNNTSNERSSIWYLGKTSGYVYLDDKLICKVSFNGRVWDLNEQEIIDKNIFLKNCI